MGAQAAVWLTAADALLRMKAASFTSCPRCENTGGAAALHAGSSGCKRLRRPRLVRRHLAISSLTAAGYENVTLTVEVCSVGRRLHQNMFLPNAVDTGIAQRLSSSRRARLNLFYSTQATSCPALCAIYAHLSERHGVAQGWVGATQAHSVRPVQLPQDELQELQRERQDASRQPSSIGMPPADSQSVAGSHTPGRGRGHSISKSLCTIHASQQK